MDRLFKACGTARVNLQGQGHDAVAGVVRLGNGVDVYAGLGEQAAAEEVFIPFTNHLLNRRPYRVARRVQDSQLEMDDAVATVGGWEIARVDAFRGQYRVSVSIGIADDNHIRDSGVGGRLDEEGQDRNAVSHLMVGEGRVIVDSLFRQGMTAKDVGVAFADGIGDVYDDRGTVVVDGVVLCDYASYGKESSA